MLSPESNRSEEVAALIRRSSSLKVGKAVVSTPDGWPPGFSGPAPSAQGSTTEAASTSVEPPSTPLAAVPSSKSSQDLSGAGQGGTPAGGRRLTAKSIPFWERELHKPKGEGAAQEGGGRIGATLPSNSATESGAPEPADGESSRQHRRTSSAPLEISPGLLRAAAGGAGTSAATRHAPNPNKCSIVAEHLRGGTTMPPARAEGAAAGSASDAVSSRFSFGRSPKLPFSKSFSKLGGSRPKSFSKS